MVELLNHMNFFFFLQLLPSVLTLHAISYQASICFVVHGTGFCVQGISECGWIYQGPSVDGPVSSRKFLFQFGQKRGGVGPSLCSPTKIMCNWIHM